MCKNQNNTCNHNSNLIPNVNTKTSIFNHKDIEVSYSTLSKYDKTYIKSAIEQSKLSYSNKLQVGCIITKDDRIISNGYNGTLSGLENSCEDEYTVMKNGQIVDTYLQTKISVFHAEENALFHLSRIGISPVGCTLYCTHSPCPQCSKIIKGMGIKEVFFVDYYKDVNGIAFLIQTGVKVSRVIDIE